MKTMEVIFKAKADGESYAIKSLAGLIFGKGMRDGEDSLIVELLTSTEV